MLKLPSPVLKYALGGLVIVVVAALMYEGVVSADAGLATIIGIAAGLGIYRRVEKKRGA